MKHLLLFITIFVFSFGAYSQTTGSEWVFEAMQEEMNRNMEELRLPDAPNPFFIAYYLDDMEYLAVTAVLGAISSETYRPVLRNHAVRLMVGDHGMTNETNFDAVLSHRGRSGLDNHTGQLRRELWRSTDEAYKSAISGYRMRQNARSTQAEPEADDFYHADPVEYIKQSPPMAGFDADNMKTLAAKLSGVFLDYPDLYNTSVELRAFHKHVFGANSEGTRLKVPMELISIKAEASVRTEDGTVFKESFEVFARNEATMPDAEEIMGEVAGFASDMQALLDASTIEEYYFGPVLLEGEAVFSVFEKNLISSPGLIAHRRNVRRVAGGVGLAPISGSAQGGSAVSFDARLDRRIIDAKLSISNHPGMTAYAGQPLLGHYMVDADGVMPPQSLQLVENGILKGFLSSRVPMPGTNGSTGSNRFGFHAGAVITYMAPGNLHVRSDEHMNRAELLDALRASAKMEGLDYAYIIKGMGSSTPHMYRLDLATGQETRVHSAEISPISLQSLRRINGVSAEEEVTHYLYRDAVPVSVIHPRLMLLEDVEIYKSPNLNRETEEILTNPLRRTLE